MKNQLREMGLTEQQITHKFQYINSQDAGLQENNREFKIKQRKLKSLFLLVS